MKMLNVIEAIEEKLQAQKDEIYFKNLQIADLKAKLAETEKEAAELKQTLSAVEKYVETWVKE